MTYRTYTAAELRAILDDHAKHLAGTGGKYANLQYANLRSANLRSADLRSANLRSANLQYANLQYARYLTADEISRRQIVPEYGAFFGYKKLGDGGTALLEIPATAGRVGGLTGRKCRAEWAKVVVLFAPDGTKRPKTATTPSLRDGEFMYRVGRVVKPDAWCDDPKIECAGGIHFFLTHHEAKEYA